MIKQTRKLSNRKVLFTAIVLSLLVLPLSAQANVRSVSFSAPQITGGTDSKGVVTLASNAPIGGLKVTLTSNNPAATFPAVGIEPAGATTSVIVPAGRNSAPFIVKTTALAQDTLITITAGAKDASQSGIFTILAPVLKGLKLADKVVGGEKASGQVSLSGPAPSGGSAISLSSSNSKATVPTKIAIPAGQSSASFDIKTVKLIGNDEQTTIEATSETGVKVSAPLTFTLPLIPEIVSMTAPTTVLPGDKNRIRFTLDRTLTDSHFIRLTSSSNVIDVFGVSLNAGENSNSYEFIAKKPGTTDLPVTITAISGNSTKTINVTVRPLMIQSVTMASNTVTGGRNLTGTISLNNPKNDPVTISLTTLDGSVTIPASVTLINGQTVNFEVFTQPVPSLRNVQLVAKLPSDLDALPTGKTVNFSVVPVAIESLALSETKCNISTRSCRTDNLTGTITLNAPAGLEGMSFSLSQDTPSVNQLTIPQIVLVPSGQSTAQFNVQLPIGVSPGVYTIRAVSGSASRKSVQLEIEKTFVDVESITLSSPESQGGSPVTGTVRVKQFRVGLTRTDDPTTTFLSQIDLSTNTPSVGSGNFVTPQGNRPTTRITMPAGQTTGTFTFIPAATSSEKTISITAVFSGLLGGGGTLISTPLIVKPPTMESITLSETNVQGGQELNAIIQLSSPIPSSTDITFTSSDPNLVPTPRGGLNNGNSLRYPITVSPNVASPATVTISATLNNQTKTAELTVSKSSALSNISLPEQGIFGRLQTTLRIELDGPAPNGGASVGLNSSNLQLIGLSNQVVTIPAGQQSINFSIQPAQPRDPIQIHITAGYKNQTKQTLVTLENLRIDFCNGIQFKGGQQYECTLSITNSGMFAPEGGFQFNVTSSNPSVLSAPTTLFIPAGQNSTTFQVTTQPVTQNTTVQFRIENNTGGLGRSVDVTPQ